MIGTVSKLPVKPRRRVPKPALPCPEHMQGEARSEWSRVTSDLAQAKTLSAENRPLLEAYCLAYARWRECEAHLAKHGPVVPAPRTGTPMHSPIYTVACRERDVLMRLADALGITPASRGRIKPAGDDAADDWGDLIA